MILRTAPHVTLRALRPDDAPILAAYRNHPSVSRYQAWPLPYPPSAAQALTAAMQGRAPGDDGWTQLALADAATDTLLGDVAVRGAGEQAEIGVTLAPHAQAGGLPPRA